MAQFKVLPSLSVLVAVLFASANSSPLSSQQEVPEGLILMGATSSKELYITAPEVVGDFTHSRAIGCPLRFQMSLAAVESPEEVAIIDNYFNSTQGNSSDAAWTSAVARIGRIPAHWASNGLRITEFPAVIQGPWPSGAGSSPAYASYNCVTLQRVCIRPPHVPIPGCFPARTQFNYSPCDVQRRYICQKNI
ncbi:hypothetical protein Ocin01_18033 [Orchesella cincta]|uniref:Uncharacterized protein n=1 Tax=Orchesella cincta TaxID=48709 RepID=A0A1D2M6P8_ORCCI|nr:hypothetical protein Ocin01_18033 [Orchesella cincta]